MRLLCHEGPRVPVDSLVPPGLELTAISSAYSMRLAGTSRLSILVGLKDRQHGRRLAGTV